MTEDEFFDQQSVSSKIKASIVSEYFPKYCGIIVKKHTPTQIRYIDLFSGPGYYKDGNPSTPILVARKCLEKSLLKEKVWLIFNDFKYSEELKSNFLKEFPEGTFDNAPFFGDRTVGEHEPIRKFLTRNTHVNEINEFPSLLFIDPFGYKGIETRVLAEFLKNWGNEIFLFVNTKRIHAALQNNKFDELMSELFPTTLESVRKDRRYLRSVSERIALIAESLAQEYKNLLDSEIYHTAFRFQEEDTQATGHYILHLTKGARGFDLVKQIYTDFANVGTDLEGANTYTFDAKKIKNETIGMFDENDPNIDKLKEIMYTKYKGKTIRAFDLFEWNQTRYLYSRTHYTSALRKLVIEKKIESKFQDGKNHEVSVLLINECILKFV